MWVKGHKEVKDLEHPSHKEGADKAGTVQPGENLGLWGGRGDLIHVSKYLMG